MRRSRKPHDDLPGQDSFLDVVANVVGILIILVMVIGARAKDAWMRTTSPPPVTDLSKLQEAVNVSKTVTAELEADINEIAGKVQVQRAAVAARQAERNQMQLIITAVQRELDDRRQALNSSDREAIEERRAFTAAQLEMAELNRQRSSVENSTAPVAVIQHIPTPMAKTVFGKEVHFRLLGGRLAYVPLDELVEKMKDEIRFKAERLREVSQTTETVGPLGNFHLRYMLRMTEHVQQTRLGPVSSKQPEFVGFYLIPTSEQLGEPLDQALQPGSQFMRLIAGLNPDTTTITVWVYPDSFNEFLTLKRELFQRGFLTASWPLPDGHPISGGPHGRRSAAQ